MTLREDGIAYLPWALSPGEVNDIHLYLADKSVSEGHVMLGGERRPLHSAAWPMFCHTYLDAALMPHFLESALRTYATVREHFGAPPYLYSVNCFWTQPSRETYQATHDWHRDRETHPQVALFLYGTDVLKPENGAHCYERGSHQRPDAGENYNGHVPPAEAVETVLGPRGTMFLVDTFGCHMGIRPNCRRMLAWFRWGLASAHRFGFDKSLLGKRWPKAPELAEAMSLMWK